MAADEDDEDDAGVPAEAREAADRASACIDERRFVDAIPDARRATALAPAWRVPWRYLTIAYKHALRFEDCLEACGRAVTGDDDRDEGIHWNAGIAATAVGEWTRARAAWKACGIDLPAGSGPIEMELGPTPIRLVPGGQAEVVWCQRIDPCRARVESVPFPESGRRYGDLVLHDGEPRGKRRLGTQEVSVFDELTLLEASSMGTWVVELDVSETALAEMLAPFEATPHEDWTRNVRAICAACSLGAPDGDGHDHDHDDDDGGWQRRRTIGIAAPSEASLSPLRGFFGRWRRGVVSVKREL